MFRDFLQAIYKRSYQMSLKKGMQSLFWIEGG